MEIPHADLSKVTRMVFIEIGSVMMLTTGHTTTTGMLAVLAYTTVTGGDMTPAVENSQYGGLRGRGKAWGNDTVGGNASYCLRVLLNRVGMMMIEGGRNG